MGVIYQIIADCLSVDWGLLINLHQFTLGIYFVLPRIECLLTVGPEHHQNWSCTNELTANICASMKMQKKQCTPERCRARSKGLSSGQFFAVPMARSKELNLQLGKVVAPGVTVGAAAQEAQTTQQVDNRTSVLGVLSEVLPFLKKSWAKTPFGDFATALQTKVWQRTRQKPLNALGSLDHAGPVWHMTKKILQRKSIHNTWESIICIL